MNEFHLAEQNGVITLKCCAFEEITALRHGFSTRIGGVSEGYLASMSFSYQKESEANVDENFRRFCLANGLPFESMVLTQQTHTTFVEQVGYELKNKGRYRQWKDVDGLVSKVPGLGLVCFVADCVPLLLVDPLAGVVAAVHSGWRGTVGRIGREAVRKMVASGAQTENILAAVGPSIGPCCFEVGPEVQAAFSKEFGENLPVVPSVQTGHTMMDLWEANRLVLKDVGLLEHHIFLSKICTSCNNKTYYSHRYTGGRRGSLIAAIALEE